MIEELYFDTEDPVASSTRDLFVDLKNLGGAELHTIVIKCEIDGVLEYSLSLDTTFSSGTSIDSILIAQHTFSDAPSHSVKLYIANVDGVADINQLNDTTFNYFYICDGPLNGTYTIGNSPNAFHSFSLATSALSSCGISGPVEFMVEDGEYSDRITLVTVAGINAATTITFRSVSG